MSTSDSRTEADAIGALGSFRQPKITRRRRKPVSLQLFESAEHDYIGNNAILHFGEGDGIQAGAIRLPLENGLQLTYGEILALAGDFYGLPDYPISDGATAQQREGRFVGAFETLAREPASVAEATQILLVLQEEIAAVDAAMLAGQQPSVAYAALGDSLSLKWNKITGATKTNPFGRYLQLAAVNWDHFGVHAVRAYQAGHRVAMLAALYARERPTPQQQMQHLARAYALNAFADHFMTDLFSGGHIRTPRKALYEMSMFPSKASGYAARYMHDEDCMWGIYARNARGDRWIAYGDKKYGNSYDAPNAELVDAATQASIDEVYAVFVNGVVPADPAQYAALQLTPDLAPFADPAADDVNYAAFFVDTGENVLARQDYSDLNDHQWSANWSVPSTLMSQRIINHDTPPPTGFLAPPPTAPVIDEWTSNQPQAPTWENGRRVRYAVSFVNRRDDAVNESDRGPWCAYAVLDGGFCPQLTIPVDESGEAQGRYVYRQFHGSVPERLSLVGNNDQTVYVDTLDV